MGKAQEMLENTAMGTLGSIGGAIGSQLGYGLGQLTDYNESLQRRQLEQQQKLTEMQYNANLGLMKESYKQQMEIEEKISV